MFVLNRLTFFLTHITVPNQHFALQVCIYGNHSGNGGKSMVMLLIPTFVLSFIGYHCDKKIFKHVKDNTFGDQNHLTEHQKMLLRIPLNAIKASLISFLPYIIIPMVKYFDNVWCKGDWSVICCVWETEELFQCLCLLFIGR